MKVGDETNTFGNLPYSIENPLTDAQVALIAGAIQASEKGAANGVATLDGDSLIPLGQIPPGAKDSKVAVDITARNAIASGIRFEGMRVHVVDASADDDVSSGSAGYILAGGLTDDDWIKTYESESIDLDLSDLFDVTTNTLDDITDGLSYVRMTPAERTDIGDAIKVPSGDTLVLQGTLD